MKQYFLDPLENLNEYKLICDSIKKTQTCLVTGCGESGVSHFIAGTSDDYNQKVIVTYDAMKAQTICEDLKGFGVDALLYPSKDLIFFSANVHGTLILKQRLDVIKRIMSGKDFTVVLCADAFLDKIVPLDHIKKHYLEISAGDEIEIKELVSKLVDMGYEIVEQVESPGQAAIRGSIVDIYTLTDEQPYRIDFWDTEIDDIKKFDIDTQRSVEQVEQIKMYPASEYMVSPEQLQEGIQKIEADLAAMEDTLGDEEYETLKYITNEFLTQVDIDPNNVSIDSYVTYFCKELCSLLDYLDNPVIYLDEPNRIVDMLGVVSNEFTESMSGKLSAGRVLPGQLEVIHDKNIIIEKLEDCRKVMFSTIAHKSSDFSVDNYVETNQGSIGTYSGRFDMLVSDLQGYIKQKYRTIIVTSSTARAKHMVEDFYDEGLTAYFLDTHSKGSDKRVCNPGEIMVVKGNLRRGFVYPDEKFVAISENDIYKERRKTKRRKTKYKGDALSGFADLNVGDYVIHENHGLGIYRGIEKITTDQIEKDYIKIEYKGGSNLYVLATQLDRIQKYADADAKKPKLNTLGSPEWGKTKSRVQKAVDEIAEELVELYYERDTGSGFRFAADNDWQREFEDLFEFEETDDQLNAIKEVKKDMESSKIMDRLICGDVGFGKTEVALRAAFKAVQDGKQVAYLVPTTVLCGQHYKTFANRF